MFVDGSPDFNEISSNIEESGNRFKRSIGTENESKEIISLTLSFKGYQFE